MQDLKALKKKFGSVTHKGIEYILDGHAHLSNRVFDGGGKMPEKAKRTPQNIRRPRSTKTQGRTQKYIGNSPK